MRQFNESEKAVLRKLASIPPEETTHLSQWLGNLYFTEKKGRALIIQMAGRYAAFYLRPELFDNEQSKRIEIVRLLEFISLIRYLAEQRYIFIYAGEKPKAKSMYFLHDAFNNPQLNSNNTITLNEKKDCTANPESVQDKDGKVIYKGTLFDAGTYEMIVNNLTGVLYVSLELRNLVRHQFVAMEDKKFKRQHRMLQAGILIAFLCALSGLFFAFHVHQAEARISAMTGSSTEPDEEQGSGNREAKSPDPVASAKNEKVGHAVRNFYGIDISKYNGDIASEIDAADSLTFMICKATEGTVLTDADFSNNWKLIKEKGIVRGAYHFFDASFDPEEQAEHYWSTIGQLDSTDIAPIIDIEQASLPQNKEVDVNELQRNLLTLLKYIEGKSNRIPMIYTSEAFANEYLRQEGFSRYPLWLAEYTNKSEPLVPVTWEKQGFRIWQKSDHYAIDSHTIDFDVFHGRIDDLYK